jgi:hypothetical protein
MEAAYSMAKGFALQRLDDVGVKLLFLAYRKKFCTTVGMLTPNSLPTFVPRRNDFRAITEYYIQKAIVDALSTVRSERVILGATVRLFLLDQLKMNDNSQNSISDSYYLANIIEATGVAFLDKAIQTPAQEAMGALPATLHGPPLELALAEIERRLFLESQIPSYRNVVAIACLTALLKWMIHGLIATDVKPFLMFSRDGNFVDVRLMAIAGLVTVGFAPIFEPNEIGDEDTVHPGVIAVLEYLLHLVETDVPYIQYAVIRSLTAFCASVAETARQSKAQMLEREKQEKEEHERMEEALKAGEEPEVEDLSLGITKQVVDLKKVRGDEANRAYQKLKQIELLKTGLWKILRYFRCYSFPSNHI